RHGIPKTLAWSLKDLEVHLGSPKHYCLESFLDSEWLCQASLSKQDLLSVVDKLKMQPLPLEKLGDEFLQMPPYWWRPVVLHDVLVYSTVHFPQEERGSDGWHCLAAWNPADEVLHMWIKDNF